MIALDTEGDEEAMVGAGSGVSMAAMLDEDLSAQPALEMGMAAPAGRPSGAGRPAGALAEGAALMQLRRPVEPPYTGWQIAGLAVCTVVLMFCGMMIYDLLRSMWSEASGGPYSINKGLMDFILGLIEGK